MVYNPITLPCNHNVCSLCLEKGIKEGFKECWTCRHKLEDDFEIDEHVNQQLKTALETIFPGYGDARKASLKASKNRN